jgi:Lrp/AsnC family transcriptional regulator for asnA, asnC and gidA
MELDEVDRAILDHLQSDARTPFSEIARDVDMSSATIHARVNRLEDAGVIEGYHASLDPAALGYGSSAIIGLQVEQDREQDALDRLEAIDGVQEVHLTTGSWDVLLRVHAADTDRLRTLVFEEIAETDGFAGSQTMVVLDTPYDPDRFPLDGE